MIEWGVCLGCGGKLPDDVAGYCRACIERLSGEPLPDTIGCAECMGEGQIDGMKCSECDGTGQVPWP